VKADGTASHSLVADFLSQAHDNADEDTMKAVALTGYMSKYAFLPGQSLSIDANRHLRWHGHRE
jgi:hypothetical protein